MGCLISCIACEAAQCLCCGAAKCCGKLMPSGIAGRVGYTVLFFVVSFIAWILRGWAEPILHELPGPLKICETEKCFGVLAVYRVCFVLAVFHLIHAILFIGCKDKSDMRAGIQDGFWLIKIGLFVAGVIGAFFIPNDFYTIFGWIALIGSLFFVLIQLLMLVDFIHGLAEKWISNYEAEEEESSFWWWVLLGSSILCYAVSIALTIVMYIFFVKDAAGCQLNAAFITMNIVFAIVIGGISMHPKVQEANPRSGLLQAAFITIYVTYLVWSSIMSEPDDFGCNPWATSSSASTVALFVGAAFTIIAVCFSTYSAANGIEGGVAPAAPESQPLITQPKDEENQDSSSTKDEAVEESGPVAYNLSLFHLIFALGALYISMLMSDWFTVDKANEATLDVNTGLAAVWVKIVSSWLAVILYAWTLLGPVIFPDRDWGYSNN